MEKRSPRKKHWFRLTSLITRMAGWVIALLTISEGTVAESRYPVVMCYMEDGHGGGFYYAFNPDIGQSACSACGDTKAEALENLADVEEYIIDYMKTQGKTIPEPSIKIEDSPLTLPENTIY